MGQTHSNRLTHGEIEELIKNSRHLSRDNIRGMYRQFKRDFPSGYITREAFLRSFRMNFQNEEGNEAFAEQLFRAHDTDGNNRVDFGEFTLSLDAALYGTAEEKLRWALRMYDFDGDGTVTHSEIVGMLRAIYSLKQVRDARRLAESNARFLMRELDLDGNRELSYDEFATAAARSRSLADIIEGRTR